MGERSQFVIGFKEKNHRGELINRRVAFHLQWCWGEHMAQRASQVISVLNNIHEHEFTYGCVTSIIRVLQVTYGYNQVTGCIYGVGDTVDDSTYPIEGFDSDHGCFLVDLNENGHYTFGFSALADLSPTDSTATYALQSTADYFRTYDLNSSNNEAVTMLCECEPHHRMTDATFRRLSQAGDKHLYELMENQRESLMI